MYQTIFLEPWHMRRWGQIDFMFLLHKSRLTNVYFPFRMDFDRTGIMPGFSYIPRLNRMAYLLADNAKFSRYDIWDTVFQGFSHLPSCSASFWMVVQVSVPWKQVCWARQIEPVDDTRAFQTSPTGHCAFSEEGSEGAWRQSWGSFSLSWIVTFGSVSSHPMRWMVVQEALTTADGGKWLP